MQNEKIVFRKTRNMNETISAASVFIRQNISILSKGVVFIAMPLFLLGLTGYYFFLMLFVDNGFDEDFAQGFEYIGVSYLFSILIILGGVVLLAVVYEFIIMYLLSPNYTAITLSDLGKRIYKNIGIYLSTTFLLYVTGTLAIIPLILGLGVVFGIIFTLTELSPLIAALGGIGTLMLLTYPFVALSFIYIVRLVERKSFIASLRRCFQLILGNWLSTLWLYTVTVLISLSITGLIPAFVTGGAVFLINLFSWENAAFLIPVFGLLYSIVSVIINVVAMIVVAFRYFSIVEQTEGIGLLRKIELIGTFSGTEG